VPMWFKNECVKNKSSSITETALILSKTKTKNYKFSLNGFLKYILSFKNSSVAIKVDLGNLS
jgi:hypothetical protein